MRDILLLTYYIGSRFEIENADNVHNPVSRLIDSAKDSNTGYHYLPLYSFDEFGNINNPTITNRLTGKELIKSPRYQASFSVTTIQLNPQELLSKPSDNIDLVGGTVWESNPADLARRSQAVLKTVWDTSTPFSPINKDLY